MSDWYPSNHTYTGDPEGRLVAPHYATMPDRIRVFDRAVKTSGWTRKERRFWRTALIDAANRWEFGAEIIELRNPLAYRPEGVTVGTYVNTPPYGPQGGYGGFGLAPIDFPETSDYDEATWDAGKGYALIHVDEVRKAYLALNKATLAGLLTHEIGHALGFGHGGYGVMRSVGGPPYHPSTEELGASEAYWGRA